MDSDGTAIIRRFYEELDRKNFDIFTELCSADFVSHGHDEPQSRAERRTTSAAFYAGLSDLKHSIEAIIAAGNTVAARLHVTGVHDESFMQRRVLQEAP